MGTFLVCPDTAKLIINKNEQVICRVGKGNGWEKHSTDELTAVDLTPITHLIDALEILFTFDPELFGIVLFGCAMLFTTGWGAGVIMRKLSKGA